MATTKNSGSVGAVLIAGLLALLLFSGGGATTAPTPTTVPPRPTTTVTATTSPTTVGTTIPPTESLQSKRFFPESASWNQPVKNLGINTDLTAKYASTLFNYAGAGGWPDIPNPGRVKYDPTTRGNYNLALGDYSVPIYDVADATTFIRVFQSVDTQRLGIAFEGLKIGDLMPWNPSWKLGPGNDGIAAIVNFQTGENWGLYRPAGSRLPYQCFDFFGPNGQAGFNINDPTHTCWGGVSRDVDLFTTTKNQAGRGAGFPKLATLTRAVEVESGAIRHALELTIFNTMFGTPCQVNSAGAPGAGSTCSFYLPPATRVEHLGAPHTNGCGTNNIPDTVASREKTVPSGIRFRVNITDQEINSWLDSRKFTGSLRSTARIFAVALRDYGFVAGAETGCNQPLIETDGFQNPKTAAIWKKLGMSNTGFDQDSDGNPDFPQGDLLYGLITLERLEVVNPA